MRALEELIARLAANAEALLQRGETATRMAAVDPVLRALGWDTENLGEVDPEISDRSGGRVDYGLRHSGRDLVLVEAKAASIDLDKHQEQLLGYAFSVGVELATLTNGLTWQLYLPMLPGRSWEQRRFAHIDFRADGSAAAASALHRFLNRNDTVSGATLTAARGELERQERAVKLRAELEEGWAKVIADPRGEARRVVARTVEELPDPDIAAFLRGVLGAPDHPVSPRSTPVVSAGPGRKAAATRANRSESLLDPNTHDWEYVRSGHSNEGVHSVTGRPLKTYYVLRDRRTGDEVMVGRGEMIKYARVEPAPGQAGPAEFTGKQPVAFHLDGTRHRVSRWRAVLAGICELLVQEVGLPRFAEAVKPIRGKKRAYFSEDRADLFMPVGIAGGQFFVEGNFSANDIDRRARQVLRAVRGTDDGFSVDTAG